MVINLSPSQLPITTIREKAADMTKNLAQGPAPARRHGAARLAETQQEARAATASMPAASTSPPIPAAGMK
jgi:hypothetical protein